MLETEASAAARNAPVIGEVLGGGYACEAEGLLAIRDDGDGVARAIAQALADAQLRPEDVGMIVAHGNGTPQSDASEAAAMRRVFGAAMPPVTAFKWAFGHLIAAAGIVDTVLALAALQAARRAGHRDARPLAAAAPACRSRPRRRRRAATSRWSSAAGLRAPTPRCWCARCSPRSRRRRRASCVVR